MITVLEWLAFGAAMLSVFCYGHSTRWGAYVGIATALLFITWGLSAAIYAAVATNVAFLALHARNLTRAIGADTIERSEP